MAVNWIVGGLMSILGLLALFMASRAVDPVIYWTGLGVFVFAVLFCFFLIGRNVGKG